MAYIKGIYIQDIYSNQSNGYIYALDKNQDIRWLYKNNTKQKLYILENGHLIVTNSIRFFI